MPTETYISCAKALPDLDTLPADALLSRKQLMALTGLCLTTLKAWARKRGKGPKVTTIEGRPKYRAGDVRAWIRGEATP